MGGAPLAALTRAGVLKPLEAMGGSFYVAFLAFSMLRCEPKSETAAPLGAAGCSGEPLPALWQCALRALGSASGKQLRCNPLHSLSSSRRAALRFIVKRTGERKDLRY